MFERADELREVGAGLVLSSNAMKALDRLEVASAVQSASSPIEVSEIRSWRGSVLVRSPMGKLGRKYGAPTVGIHRSDLHRVLLNRLGDGVVRLGAQCEGFQQDGAGVTARFSDGQEERADLIVGADGLHSVVRVQLLGGENPRYSGYTSWRGVADFEHGAFPPGLLFEAWGRGERFGMVPMGQGRVYWYATRNAPEGGQNGDWVSKGEVMAQFHDWFTPIPEVIDATEESAILRADIFDRKPVKRWGQQKITLLGDAAHPATPDLGQGASQAIEDAVVLAWILSEPGDVQRSLRLYESQRMPRTAATVNAARRLGAVAQWENGMARWVRDMVLKITPTSLILKGSEWLMKYEPPRLVSEMESDS